MARTFTDSARATVASDGVATVALGPGRARETWDVRSVTVTHDGTDNAEARVYTGEVGDATFLEGTYSGNRDTSHYTPGTLQLDPGEILTVQWTDGTSGAGVLARVRYALL